MKNCIFTSFLVQRHIYEVWEIYWFGVSLFSPQTQAIQQENFWKYGVICTTLSLKIKKIRPLANR